MAYRNEEFDYRQPGHRQTACHVVAGGLVGELIAGGPRGLGFAAAWRWPGVK